jgi:hypothetical protein
MPEEEALVMDAAQGWSELSFAASSNPELMSGNPNGAGSFSSR